jgi:cob(I)alamin adenosyltransferase
MVRLSKIYTRTGDDGTTGLGDGGRVPKTDLRVEAYGTVDEANAAVGMCILHAGSLPAVAELLRSIQHDLFDVGADLCTPIAAGGEKPGERLRVTAAQTERLEAAIDRFNEGLKALNSFVLPGGTPLAAALHMARTIVRRAERCTVALQQSQPAATNPEATRYLNRLSDLLFVLGRVANTPETGGTGDVLWVPGANRGQA